MKKCLWILLAAMVLFLFGCGREAEPATTVASSTENAWVETDAEVQTQPDDFLNSLDAYMAAVEEESNAIKTYLEKEAQTQYDLNVKSQELFVLWDGALNYLWDAMQERIPEAEYAELLDAQRAWIEKKENQVAEAGKEFEGGSLYPLIVNGEAAALTEERVYELYHILKNR